jgi:hypothetical protein
VLRRCLPWIVPVLLVGFAFSLTWTIWLLTAVYLCLGPAIWVYQKILEISD